MKSYSKVQWLDERSHYVFIDKLFSELGEYYDGFIKDTYETPYSYSERTFVGHLAQSACRNDYYSIQDYTVNAKGTKKRLKSLYVPDLHIWIPRPEGDPDTCVFEAKITHASPIDKDPNDLSQLILNKLGRADEQINSQGLKEAWYRCALVASPVQCSRTKWSKYGSTPKNYKSKVDELYDNIGSFLKPDANFVWTYMLDYENAKRLEWKDQGNTYVPWIGVICTGKVRRYLA